MYLFHAGYWGPHIGFYGGVNYGYGYGGVGFAGGRWVGNSFAYNTAVVRVNTTVVRNVYVNNVTVNNITVNRVSYNGGAGGVAAAPTPQERAVMSEQHLPPTPVQHQHVSEAVRNPRFAARANGGHPSIAATARPAAFSGPGVVGSRGAPPPRPAAPATGYGARPGQPQQFGAGAHAPAGRACGNGAPGRSGCQTRSGCEAGTGRQARPEAAAETGRGEAQARASRERALKVR